MSLNVTLRDLLEAGVHFGHQTTRWNPKMKRFIFEQRNKIHIIDLQKTMELLGEASDFVKNLSSRGHKVLLVGTKKQAKEAIKEAATRCGAYYVNERWLGGLLTNFVTMRKSAAHYKHIQSIIDDGSIDKMPGKEASSLRREWTKLHRNLEGIKDMESLPAAVFIVDPKREGIAVSEARKLKIPVVAIADTNCDPDLLDYPIPGNDDALRTIKLFAGVIADAVLEGKKHMVITAAPEAPAKPAAAPVAGAQDSKGARPRSSKPVVRRPQQDKAPQAQAPAAAPKKKETKEAPAAAPKKAGEAPANVSKEQA